MKIFKRMGFIALAAMCVSSVSLYSCKDQDKEEDDEPINGGSGNESVIINFDGQRLSSIGPYFIYYDNSGRVSEIEGGDINCEFNYSKGTFTYNGETGQMKFNNKGYISELSYPWNDIDGDYLYTGTADYKFNYDGNRLSSIDMEYEDSYKNLQTNIVNYYEGTISENLNWEKNNLVTTSIREIGYINGDKGVWHTEYDVEYGSKTNEFNQIPIVIMDYALVADQILGVLGAVGLLGEGPVNLPVSIDEIDEGRYDYTVNVSFSLNSNGSISKETYDDETINYRYSKFSTKSADILKPNNQNSNRPSFLKNKKYRTNTLN